MIEIAGIALMWTIVAVSVMGVRRYLMFRRNNARIRADAADLTASGAYERFRRAAREKARG